jgi:hypothetical protein
MADPDFKIEQGGYVAFDAISLKDLIIERLNDQEIFTDQNYEGSNLSAVIDIVAYSYHVLIYYLNKNSSESLFSQAELYENINQIVKSIDYNPTGPQTANLSFECVANASLPKNLYTIPRYSYFTTGGTSYSFTEDISFQKTVDGVEILTDFQNNNLLYNGEYVEFPTFSAIGEDNEVAILATSNPNTNFYIDNNSIDVYVLPSTGNKADAKWEKWTRTSSLYLENASAKKYSVRFNENEQYEIKFGNNINGKRLEPGSQVAIYYLKSDAAAGQLSKGQLNNQELYYYNTTQFNTILNDTLPDFTNLITRQESANLTFSNKNSSTNFKSKETVQEIKQNAPNLYNSQYRLITTGDYENYISKNFGNFISSTKVVNNFKYTDEYQRYFFDIGLVRPNDDSRVLFNQVNFSDSCDFNNVYIFAVPNKILTNSLDIRTNYLSIAQKNAITTLLNDIKSATNELVVTDPVYMEINFGVSNSSNDYVDAAESGDDTSILIEIDKTSLRDLTSVKNDVEAIFKNYFSSTNLELGQIISIKDLNDKILNVDGVVTFSTNRIYKNENISSNGLSLLIYNPVYSSTDFRFTEQDIPLKFFQYAYFKNLDEIIEKIEVIRQG